MADGGYLLGSVPAAGIRDPEALVGEGYWAHRSGYARALFGSHPPCPPRYVAKGDGVASVRRTAWYEKSQPTFSDALALVRRELWVAERRSFCGSAAQTETVEIPREFIERLTDAVCYAA